MIIGLIADVFQRSAFVGRHLFSRTADRKRRDLFSDDAAWR